MDTFNLLMQGFSTALQPQSLLFALMGAFLGTLVGILPGLGPPTTIALLIPITFTVNPSAGLIMMTAIYLGAMYGSSLTSVLLKVPGEPSAVMTAIDGYELAKKGKAGKALAISAIGSFIGGTLSVVALMLLAVPLSHFALRFGPAEYAAIMVFALILSATLIGDSFFKGILSAAFGIGVAMVGTDLQSGEPRLTMGLSPLLDGVNLIVAIIGVFGVGEVLTYFATRHKRSTDKPIKLEGKLLPTFKEFLHVVPTIGRGGVVGFIAGLLPGSGSTIGSFLSYSVEKRISKHPETFGKGEIKGVASTETANNASTSGALVPLLTLGIPGSGTTAVLLGVLMMYGIRPGPQLMTQQSHLVWAIIASLYISNIVLLIFNLPMIRFFVKILDIPPRVMMPLILVIAMIGAYSINNSVFDIWLVLLFGVVGLFMRIANLSPAIFVLALVLGDQMEQSLRQMLILSQGSLAPIFTSPIADTVLGIALLAILSDIFRKYRRKVKYRRDQHPPISTSLDSKENTSQN